MKTLIYCLNILKIKEDSELYRNVVELVQKEPIESANESSEWIRDLKIIANASLTCYIFSQSQLSDFLTLSTKGIVEKKMSSEIIIFKMYRDIIENYESFSHSLKSNYPGIIVDVISTLHKGIDTKGTRVNPISIEKYYQSRNQQAAMTEGEQKEESAISLTAATAIHKEKIRLLSKNDLVESLSQITNRGRKELEQSLASLQDSGLKKISELCRNYSRLQHYSKLITNEGSQQVFRKEIQRDLGRELRPYQLTRAANSIRRVQVYIENILIINSRLMPHMVLAILNTTLNMAIN